MHVQEHENELNGVGGGAGLGGLRGGRQHSDRVGYDSKYVQETYKIV